MQTLTTGTAFLYKNNFVLNRAPRGLVKPGEWYRLELICYRNRLTMRLDGKSLGDHAVPGGIQKRGTLGLSCAGDSTVRFRNIEIKEGPPEELGWVKLFNGNDFNGWVEVLGPKVDPQKKPWHAADGALVMAGGAETQSYLYADRKFGDFVLEMEYQHTPNAPCGPAVWLHTEDAAEGFPKMEANYPSKGKTFPERFIFHLPDEFAILLSPTPYDFQYVMPEAEHAQKVKRKEWNHLRITRKGLQLEWEVNSVHLARLGSQKQSSAYVAFDTATVGAMKVRNIRIRETISAPARLEIGK